MATEPESRRAGGVSGRAAGILTAIGGAAMAVGSVLAFVTVEADFGFGVQSQTVGGLDTDDGRLFLGTGIGLVVAGLVIFALRSAVVRRILGGLGVVVAGFMTYAGVVDITTIADDLPEGVTATAGIGLYVALAGAIVALIGSAMAVFARSGEPAPGAVPPPLPPPEMPRAGPQEPPPPPEELPEEPPPPPEE